MYLIKVNGVKVFDNYIWWFNESAFNLHDFYTFDEKGSLKSPCFFTRKWILYLGSFLNIFYF